MALPFSSDSALRRFARKPAVLLIVIVAVILVPRLLLLPVSGHYFDLNRHYVIAQYIVQHGLLKMYDSPMEVNHPPIGVALYSGSAWVWSRLGGDLAADYNPDDGWQVAALKVPCLLFELALIGLIYGITRREAGQKWAIGIMLLFALSPGHLTTVMGMGQTDAMFSFFLVVALYLIRRQHPRWAWAAYAVGWLSKFQSVMLLPLLVVLTVRRFGWRTLVICGVIFAVILVGGMLPFVLTSGSRALVPFGTGSVDRFPYITNGSFNVWFWVSGTDTATRTPDSTPLVGGLSYFQAGMLSFVLVTALICLRAWLLPRREDDYLLAAAAGIAFFMLPTQIHSRYLYAGLMFLALSLWQHPRLIPLYIGFALNFGQNLLDTMHRGSAKIPYPRSLFFWDESLNALANTLFFIVLLAYVLWPLWPIRREIPRRLRDSLWASLGQVRGTAPSGG